MHRQCITYKPLYFDSISCNIPNIDYIRVINGSRLQLANELKFWKELADTNIWIEFRY